jgi:hypothetical protein
VKGKDVENGDEPPVFANVGVPVAMVNPAADIVLLFISNVPLVKVN